MKRAAILIIFVSVLTLAFLLLFGTVVKSKDDTKNYVEVKNTEKLIRITPSGDEDTIVLADVLTLRGLDFQSLSVDGEVRQEIAVIFIENDFDKQIKATFVNKIGMKTVYEVKIILTHFVKFYVDGVFESAVSKMKVASNQSIPHGVSEWFTDVSLQTPYDPEKIADVFSLYGRR